METSSRIGGTCSLVSIMRSRIFPTTGPFPWGISRRVVRAALDLRHHAGRLPFEPGTAQGVLQRLHEQVPDTSLAVGDANVEPHWRHLLLGQHHAEQDLADHRAVSMGNQQPVLRPDQGDERRGRGVGDHFLLLGGAADVLRMGGVTAYRYEERIRDGHAQPPRYAARAASTPAPRDSLCFSWERIASSAPRVLRTASARALYPMVPMRQMRPCSGPKEVPISMLKSSRSARRTFSPSTPGGICTPVTFAILWRWSPKSLSPIAWRPAVSAREARAWRAKARSRPSPSRMRAHSRPA